MTTPTKEVAAQAKLTPAKFVEQYADSFTAALPSHIEPAQWLAVAIDAVRRDPKIEKAANNDLRAFTAALRQAARMGLEPGTEAFYLVPFAPKAGAPQIIQGIVGYQGLVEMMYRAGAIQSVKAELIKEADQFAFNPADEKPHHVIDWLKPRGKTLGAYAYAVMEGGATSKVVVMGLEEIDQHRAKSASANSKYSPWQTSFDAMALKTVVRQLAKWVPTSAEYRREKLRSAQAVWDERARKGADAPEVSFTVDAQAGEHVDPLTGEIETDFVEAEVVEEPAPQPEAAPPAPGFDPEKRRSNAAKGAPISDQQVKQLAHLAEARGLDWPEGVRAEAEHVFGAKVASIRALKRADADTLIAALSTEAGAVA